MAHVQRRSIIAGLLVLVFLSPAAAAPPSADIEMFTREGCPYCAAALAFLEDLYNLPGTVRDTPHGDTPTSTEETTMATNTTYTLDEFLADTRATIKTKGVPSGLAEIRDHLEKLLHNPELLKKHLGDPPPYTQLTAIGHDPETDVHVLVHGREKAGKSSVHDHGPCWVIYGNYRNPTRMRRWRRLDDGTRPGHAELELQREFLNEPGQAVAFAVGDIHSIEFGDDTFFIRVTGGDVETKETLRFDVAKKTVEVANRAQGQQ